MKEVKSIHVGNEDFEIMDEKARPVINVDTMKSLQNLVVGDVIKTLGYYELNDGGSALYLIKERTGEEVEDSGSIHFIGEGLVGELILNGIVNIKQFGAKGDGIQDDTTAIQSAINYLASKYSSDSLYGNKNTIEFPNGNYCINSTITIPFFIHLKGKENVLIKTKVDNAPAIIFSNENNPSNGLDFFENYFNFSKVLEPLIENIVFVNQQNVIKENGFLISNANNTTCVQIGKNTESINAYYSLKNVVIANYNIGLLYFLKNNYLCTMDNVTLFTNNYGCKFGDGSVDSNSGEKMAFKNSNISNNRVAIEINGQTDVNLENTSLDYNQLVFLIDDVESAGVKISNSHIEGFYSKEYIDEYNLNDLLNDEYYGLVYINRPTKSYYKVVSVLFNNVSISGNRGFANTIRALKDGSNRNEISFNNVQISGVPATNKTNYKHFLENKNSICNNNICVITNKIIPSWNRQLMLLQDCFNLVNDSFLKNADVGKTGNYYSNTEIGNIKVLEQYNGNAYIINADSNLNNNVIQFGYDNTSASVTVFLQANTKIPCKVGDIFTSDGLVNNIENGVLTKGIRIYDKDDNLLEKIEYTDNVVINVGANEYQNFGNEVFSIKHNTASYIIPTYRVKINKNESPNFNNFKISNLQCYKL